MSHDIQDMLTISEAMQLASDMGIRMSRPTFRKMIAKNHLGYQMTGKYGNWTVSKERLLKYLDEKLDYGKKS